MSPIAIFEESTLNAAEYAFSSVMTLADIPINSSFLFRVVSKFCIGHEIWVNEAPGTEPSKRKVHIFKENEKSKAIRLRKSSEDSVDTFLAFCAYLPQKKMLQFMKIKPKAVFKEMVSAYQRHLPEHIYDVATCTIGKSQNPQGRPQYNFAFATTLDHNCVPSIVRNPLPKECLELLKMMPFDMEKIYSNEDPFCVESFPSQLHAQLDQAEAAYA